MSELNEDLFDGCICLDGECECDDFEEDDFEEEYDLIEDEDFADNEENEEE